jgi:signal peptidase I
MTAIASPRTTGRHLSTVPARGIAVGALLRRTVRLVVGAVLTLAALASIALAALIVVGHIGFSPVLSPSMVPAFAPGDLVVTQPEAASDIKVGQVLVLPVPGEPGQRYVHRVISVTYKDGLPVVQTKGDANPAPEQFKLRITSAKVPQVVTTIPHLGRLAILLRGGMWRAVAVGLIGLLLLVGVKRAFFNRR